MLRYIHLTALSLIALMATTAPARHIAHHDEHPIEHPIDHLTEHPIDHPTEHPIDHPIDPLQPIQGIGIILRNTCDRWQRVIAGLVGGPEPVTLDVPRNQTIAHLLCDSPWACGYDGTWDTPKAHWLDATIETQDRRQVYDTLTTSATGGMASYFVIDLCPTV